MEQYEEANEDISKEVEGFAWRKYRFLVKKKKSITLNISRIGGDTESDNDEGIEQISN